MLPLLSLSAAVLLAPPAARADQLTAGPWTVSYGPNSVAWVRYGETLVSQELSVVVFRPDYHGAEFALADAEVKHEQAGDTQRLIFTHDVPGKARGTATLEIEGNRLRWSVAMEIAVAGDLEACVPVPAETLETPFGDLFFSVDGADREVVAGHSWSTLLPRREVRLKAGTADIILRPDAQQSPWIFQDYRPAGARVVRLVACTSTDGKQLVRVNPSLEVVVEPLPSDAAHVRALLQGQRRVTRRDVPVKNPGFEDPEALAGWSHAANAQVVQEEPPEGKSCARIEVAKPDDSVYLTQNVPVTPGASYRVSCRLRAQNVVADGRMKMPCVGAVLVHEWADAQGNWLCPGSYSPGYFGTTGWTSVECDELMAPVGAGYAVIFLGCRGVGTAFFDDLKMVEIKHHTVIFSPLDQAVIDDNRPLFAWRLEPTASTYTIECRGANGGFTFSTADTSFRPPDRMAPGRYEWQVTGEGAAPSVRWSFTQTAPETADTTGPELSVRPQSFTGKGGVLPVAAQDLSGLDLKSVRLVLDGKEAPARVRSAKDGFVVQPAGGWPRGPSTVQVTVADRAGNKSTAETWVINTPAPPRRYTWTDDQGISDGRRCFLPVGMYQVPPAEMPRVKAAGFNLVHTYEFEGSQDDVAARRFLDAAQANGLQVFMGFDRGAWSGSGLMQMNLQHVARRLGALRDHPALLAWYLYDEPDGSSQYVSPSNLRALYEFIHALDPYHPVIVTFASDNAVKQYGKCYDVHWTQVYGPTAFVRGRILLHRGMLEGRPLAAILTCNDLPQSELIKAGQPVDDTAFTPTLPKFRADLWMALALRSSGLSYWWYGDKRHSWLTAADVPQGWEWLSQAVAELHAEEPLLTADGEELATKLSAAPPDAPVAARARRVGHRVLVLVATAEEKTPAQFTLTIPGLPPKAIAEVRFEGRKITVTDGTLSDTLEPLGRHVYEIRG